MNIFPMIAIIALTYIFLGIAGIISISKTRKQIRLVITTFSKKIKDATTISELININIELSKIICKRNSTKLKSFLYLDAKPLLTAINSKLELLNKLK